MQESTQTNIAGINSSDILTCLEVAKILKVSKGTVYAMCDRGELPYRKLGNRRRIPGWLLIDWLNGKTSEGDE